MSKTKKILIKSTDEITDIIRYISEVKADNVLLTFIEDSDILISPINLNVIQYKTDELKKPLIVQIIDNPAGVRNSLESDIVIYNSSGKVPDDKWGEAISAMKKRRKGQKGVDVNLPTPVEETEIELGQDEQFQENVIDLTTEEEGVSNPKDDPKNDSTNEEEINSEPTNLNKDQNQIEIVDNASTYTQEKPADAVEVEEESFSERINSALEKSKENIKKKKSEPKIVEQGGIAFGVGSDINHELDSQSDSDKVEGELFNEGLEVEKKKKEPSIIGKDFHMPSTRTDLDLDLHEHSSDNSDIHLDKINGKNSIMEKIKNIFALILGLPFIALGFIKNFFGKGKDTNRLRNSNSNMLSSSKINPNTYYKIGIGLLILGIISYVVVYNFFPKVNMNIYVESKTLSSSTTFTGSPDIEEFSIENKEMPIRSEDVEVSASSTGEATGEGSTGEKARGVVSVQCFLGTPTSIPAGTVLSFGNRAFTTDSDLELSCPDTVTVSITAADIGPEFNVDILGSSFSIAGYSATEVQAQNTNFQISGGTKDEFTVVAQADIDAIVEDLRLQLRNEALSEINDLSQDGWEVIEDSIDVTVDDEIETDVNPGDQAEFINVSLKGSASGLLFNSQEFAQFSKDILESENGTDFSSPYAMVSLDQDTSQEIEIKSVNDEEVIIEFNVSTQAKINVDESAIAKDLSNKDWEEGLIMINDFDFTSKPTAIGFSPTWMPNFMWHFPRSTARINIVTKEVTTEIQSSLNLNQ